MPTTRRILTLLIASLLSLPCSLAMADTKVTVTDNSPTHAPCLRWDQFSTDVSASVTDPPQSDAETTITGPTYQWSCSDPSPGFHVTGSGNSGSATLESVPLSISVALTPGQYSITVNCTVTYTSTDNITGVSTPLSFTGSTIQPIAFFVRAPYRIWMTQPKTHKVYNGDITTMIEGNQTLMIRTWGHVDTYQLEVEDNQIPHQQYGNGLIIEGFPTVNPAGIAPNGSSGPGVWQLNPDGTGSPVIGFTDAQQFFLFNDPGPVDFNMLEYSFVQSWDCMEATPPYSSPQLYTTPGTENFLATINDTSLIPHHVDQHFGYAVRSFPDDPYPNT